MSFKETLKDFFWNTPKEARSLVTGKIERLRSISKPSKKDIGDLQEAYAERRALNGYGVAITVLTLLLLLILLSFMVLFPPTGGPLAASLALAHAGLLSAVPIVVTDLAVIFSMAAFASAVFIGAFSIRLHLFEKKLIKEDRCCSVLLSAVVEPRSRYIGGNGCIQSDPEDPLSCAPNKVNKVENGIDPQPLTDKDLEGSSSEKQPLLSTHKSPGYSCF